MEHNITDNQTHTTDTNLIKWDFMVGVNKITGYFSNASLFPPNEKNLLIKTLNEIDIKNKCVVDFGCGSGIILVAASSLGAKRIIGIDRYQRCLDRSAHTLTQYKDILGQMPELILADSLMCLQSYNISEDIILLCNPCQIPFPSSFVKTNLVDFYGEDGRDMINILINTCSSKILHIYIAHISFSNPEKTIKEFKARGYQYEIVHKSTYPLYNRLRVNNEVVNHLQKCGGINEEMMIDGLIIHFFK